MAAFTLERWGDPAANYTLASQLLERMVVLLLGYALIFFRVWRFRAENPAGWRSSWRPSPA
jgi:hypothetical protein